MPEDLEFNTVRVLCNKCGWFRNIGYTGIKNGVRAIIRIRKSKDPSHILHGKVLEFPADKSLEEISSIYPEYRDLKFEAHQKGLNATLREFNPLIEGSYCPRCKREENLCLDSIIFHGREIKF